MATVKSGIYSIKQLLDIAKVDFEKVAAADHLDGAPDHRRIKVGGVNFDNIDKVICVPEKATEIIITLDDESICKISVV